VPRTRIAFFLLLTGGSYSACARPQQLLSDPVPRQAISTSPAEKPGHAGYAGDDVCNSCHQDKLQTFPLTAHHRTSQLPSADSIAGKFTPSDKTMKTVNPGLSFRMDAKDDGFYQTAVFGEPPNTKEHSEVFGIVIGSGGRDKRTCIGKEMNSFNYRFPTGRSSASGLTARDIWTERQILTAPYLLVALNAMRLTSGRSLLRAL
jgi:hypothetical protein